jgi:5,10-methenyltetrahydromethanopterin hydrogenase
MRAFINIKVECVECAGAAAIVIAAPIVEDECFLVIDREAVDKLLITEGWHEGICPMCGPTPPPQEQPT